MAVRPVVAAVAAVAAVLVVVATVPVVAARSAPGPATAVPLSIAVSGNHFVDGDGRTVRLLGVDVPGSEYACEQGWGYGSLSGDTTLDAATASSIAAWDADAVRVPLNEDCWLGLNGEPSYGTVAGYRQSVEDWVTALDADGLYAILDLHWSAPGTTVADGQRPMPDDHSAAFWTSVASTFEANPAVVFDAFNEPYSPAADGDSSDAVSWTCWEDGGCPVPDAADGTTPDDADSYTAVGMQALVTTIRSTGATQPILLGGLSYANDLSGWLAHEPTDPDHQLAASFHNYYGEACDTATCWDAEVAPVAADVPVVTGELDQGYDCQGTPTSPASLVDFDTTYLDWADAEGVSYLAWGWWQLSPDPGTTACSDAAFGGGGDTYALIDDDGDPVAPDGTALRDHLEALAAAGSPGVTMVGADGSVFAFPTVGTTGFRGSAPGHPSSSAGGPAVAVASTPDRGGYLVATADGDVYGFGDAAFEGSVPATYPTDHVSDIVAVVPTADGRGYLLVGADGSVYPFGDARSLGSLPGLGDHVDDVVGLAWSSGGGGYWLVESDGTVDPFGTAPDLGDADTTVSPVAAVAPTPVGDGFWTVTRAGGIEAFGDATGEGSLPPADLTGGRTVVAIVPTSTGAGYLLVADDGSVYPFGDAVSTGSLPSLRPGVTDVVGATAGP